MKIIKRSPNSTLCTEEIKLHLECDSYNILNKYAQYLNITKEDLIELLLNNLKIINLPKKELHIAVNKINSSLINRDPETKYIYNIIKVEKNENLLR